MGRLETFYHDSGTQVEHIIFAFLELDKSKCYKIKTQYFLQKIIH